MGRRKERVAEAIRAAVSQAIVEDMKDPRLGFVTVTRVKPSSDMRQANVYVSILGDDKQRHLTLLGLQHARGFLQGVVAQRVGLRYTPRLHFYEDESVKGSLAVSKLIDEVRRADEQADNPPSDASPLTGDA